MKISMKGYGENTATFSGDNTTSVAAYTFDTMSSFASLAMYVFTKWLPMFIKTLPDLITSYAATGTF